jgi:phosphohistidine phosphatase
MPTRDTLPLEKWIRQAAAIPLRDNQVCLVTSSSGQHWVIPKGIIEVGQTAPDAALQEAWEEAGVTGALEPEPVGQYCYEKWGGVCHVIVFRLTVAQVLEDWPERGLRQRCWLPADQAVERIENRDLRKILQRALL